MVIIVRIVGLHKYHVKPILVFHLILGVLFAILITDLFFPLPSMNFCSLCKRELEMSEYRECYQCELEMQRENERIRLELPAQLFAALC